MDKIIRLCREYLGWFTGRTRCAEAFIVAAQMHLIQQYKANGIFSYQRTFAEQQIEALCILENVRKQASGWIVVPRRAA